MSGIDALFKEVRQQKLVFKDVVELNERFISRLNTRHAMLDMYIKKRNKGEVGPADPTFEELTDPALEAHVRENGAVQ